MNPELENFDGDFVPSQSVNRPGLDSLPDGEFSFEMVGAELTRTAKDQKLILRQVLKVTADHRKSLSTDPVIGTVVERAYFFHDVDAVNRLGGDLMALGFDADRWTGNRRFSVEFPKAVERMPGIKFKGKKSTTAKGEKTYHNLMIVGLLARGQTPPPPSPVLAGAGGGGKGSSGAVAAPDLDDGDLPF